MAIGEGGSRYRAPTALRDEHDTSTFQCGKPPLDEWLRSRAARNERGGHSRTFVVAEGHMVCGYYALAAGGVMNVEAPSRLRRNAPNVIPVTILARLAIDTRHQGAGLGKAMLRDAMLRTARAAAEVASAALLVHAIDEEAAAFYARYGFAPFPRQEHTLYLSLATILQALQKA